MWAASLSVGHAVSSITAQRLSLLWLVTFLTPTVLLAGAVSIGICGLYSSAGSMVDGANVHETARSHDAGHHDSEDDRDNVLVS